MTFYTDIAAELYQKRCKSIPNGVKVCTAMQNGITLTKVDILRNGLRRAKGTYVTMDFSLTQPFDKSNDAVMAVAAQLRSLLPKSGTVLVAGIGNRRVTADALGALTADKIFASRGVKATAVPLRPVAVLCTDVCGATGITSAELLICAIRQLAPSCVLCIDSLCTKEASRLGHSVQISTAGLTPRGSQSLNEATLGVPTLAIGMPTVMELYPYKNTPAFMVTPKDIDAILQSASALLSLAINKALQSALSVGELNFIMS